MTKNSKFIAFLDDDDVFLDRAKNFSKKRGLEIHTFNSVESVLEALDKDCSVLDVICVNIDKFNLEDLKKLKTSLENSNCPDLKILTISGPMVKFSTITLEKIKYLTPLDLIRKTQNTEEMLFKIMNAIFHNNPKRRNPRTIIQVPVECTSTKGSFTAKCFSLSKDGIFIETEKNFSTGDEVKVNFKLPGFESEFQCDCKVLYSLDGDQNPFQIVPKGVGLLFTDIDEKLHKQIEMFVKARE